MQPLSAPLDKTVRAKFHTLKDVLKPGNSLKNARKQRSADVQRRPRPLIATSRAVKPINALTGSPSDILAVERKKSSYGITSLIPFLCDQQLVFNQFIRTSLSERSRAGLSVHRENLVKRSAPAQYIEWTTPEEETAHIFIHLSHSVETLMRIGVKSEFVVFGYHFGRAFHGAVDQVQAIRTSSGSIILRILELKTSTTRGLGRLSMQKAIAQGTLYVFFLRQILDRDMLIDFEKYFRARGLDIDAPFRPEFSSALLKHLHPELVEVALGKPESLRDLANRWKAYVEQLPPLRFEDHIQIAVQQLARLSGVSGFGLKGGLEVYQLPRNTDGVLDRLQGAVDVLDGHKGIVGIPPKIAHICSTCPYGAICKVRPDKYEYTQRQPYTGGEQSRIPPQILPAPDPPSSITRRATQRRREGATVSYFLEKLRSPRAKATPTRDRAEIVKELAQLRRTEEKILSQIELIKLAKRVLAGKQRQQQAAEKERQRLRAVYIAGMRKAQRRQATLQRKSGNPAEYAGLVPYELPQVDTKSIVLYKPSFARLRTKAKEVTTRTRNVSIPQGGQAIPEDDTYSLEKLHHIPGSTERWIYQFELGPSLSEQQSNLMQEEEQLIGLSGHESHEVLTEAEMEEVERDTRRARRREERARRQHVGNTANHSDI
ncbi:hypothetical protein FRC20_001117 [Serendipita sp. 405]|nr:hypothetical protein FRC20_001117 [Serendipita sp. 405]